MKKLLFTNLFFAYALVAGAQTPFFSTAKIEYEKTVSLRQMYKDLAPEFYEMIKDRLPAATVSYYDFIGDSTHSIFKPGREVPVDPRNFGLQLADKNVVYTDFAKGSVISQKPVFEETFLVEDSMQKIRWKLTPDTRTIAGYECRKAIGILNDTIAVFAFYTDEIMVSGGPEGIQGLPGMILGMGIPRLHTTWFATKVEVFNVNMKAVTPATKGKKVNRQTMVQSLDKVLRQWGPYGSKLIVAFLI